MSRSVNISREHIEMVKCLLGATVKTRSHSTMKRSCQTIINRSHTHTHAHMRKHISSNTNLQRVFILSVLLINKTKQTNSLGKQFIYVSALAK